MSATGRKGMRREADFYPTPAWCVQRLLDHVALPGGDWLEPGAGEGHIIRAVNAERSDVRWTAVEIRKDCLPFLEAARVRRITIHDFPSLGWKRSWDVCLGNPPYLEAREHIAAALRMADQVVMLLSVGFLASKDRRGFFEKHGTPDVYVLPDRPSFTNGGTDSTTYAWMRWKADGSQEGRVSILYEKRQMPLFAEASP